MPRRITITTRKELVEALRLRYRSAATIDHMLAAARAHIDGHRKAAQGRGSAIHRSIPVRTFAAWLDPPPGFFEIALVEHCGGPQTDGDYVHTRRVSSRRTAPSCGDWLVMAARAGSPPRRPSRTCTHHRLYISYFQPSFKLNSKTRDRARVHKVYFTPATPCDRLLAHSSVGPAIRAKPTDQFRSPDPVQLLQEIRLAQQTLSDIAAHGVRAEVVAGIPAISDFVASLASAWKCGEVRPTHRNQPTAKHWWKTRVDPFADAWPVVEGWLIAEPAVPAKALMKRLATLVPDV